MREGWMKKTQRSESKRVEMCPPPLASANHLPSLQAGATGLDSEEPRGAGPSPRPPRSLQGRPSRGQGAGTKAVGPAGRRVPN